MTYIENVFICMASPLLIAALCMGRRQAKFFLCCLAGMGACLLSAYINTFFAALYAADTIAATAEIAPVVEEVMKLLPLLFYLLVFEPEPVPIKNAAIIVALSFATFENVCYLIQNGAGHFSFIFFRGIGTGAMHVICGAIVGGGLAYVWQRTWLKIAGTCGLLGASCPFGTKLVLNNQLPWLEVSKSKSGPAPSTTGTPATDVAVSTPVEEYYTLMLKDVTATSDVNSKFEIINLGDATQTLELTVELLDPAITTIELTGTTGGAAYNNYKITDVPRTDGSTVEVKITSPQGVTASTLSSWFTIAETAAFTRTTPTDATGSQTFTLTVKDAVTDFTAAPIVLKNNISGMEDVTVLVSAAAVAP